MAAQVRSVLAVIQCLKSCVSVSVVQYSAQAVIAIKVLINDAYWNFLSRALATLVGTNLVTSPSSEEISLTREEEI